MKGLGGFLIFAGIVVIVMAIFGFILLANTGATGQEMDLAIGFADLFDAQESLSVGEQLQVFCIQNRVVLLIAGAASLIVGFVLRKKSG